MNPRAEYISNAKIVSPGFVDNPITVEWRCPSNIAIVKYWGKKDIQVPGNPSISFTLSKSLTYIKLTAYPINYKKKKFSFLFNKEENETFERKINSYLKGIEQFFPFLERINIEIETFNTFPYGAGIASSASAFGALALALTDLEKKLSDIDNTDFYRKASYIARLGSGSAARSVYGGWNLWGKTDEIENSSDYYAININEITNSIFKNYKDTILIINSKQKKISSSEGHNLMKKSPFSQLRFSQANDRIKALLNVLKSGDIPEFIKIVEDEALSLHSMLMLSSPGYILFEPNTLAVINRIREFRYETNLPVCFTLDAGANVHLLFPSSEKKEVGTFITNELIHYCEEGKIIDDEVGEGPEKIISQR